MEETRHEPNQVGGCIRGYQPVWNEFGLHIDPSLWKFSKFDILYLRSWLGDHDDLITLSGFFLWEGLWPLGYNSTALPSLFMPYVLTSGHPRFLSNHATTTGKYHNRDKMRTFTLFSSLLTVMAVVKAADYGPCPYKENENCWEIMDNTACFLNPTSTEQIFTCITGGKEGVGTQLQTPASTPKNPMTWILTLGACRSAPATAVSGTRLSRT